MADLHFTDNEEQRLRELHALNILDTPIDEGFERITRVAKHLFDVPIAAISMIDERRQWFKSIQGADVVNVSLEASFCKYAILENDVLVVKNALEDDRFKENPFVTGDSAIRFYAGYPIRSRAFNVGSICIIDRKTRNFTNAQYACLKDLSSLVENEIIRQTLSQAQQKLIQALDKARMDSLVDPLTRLWNRQGIHNILKYKMKDLKKDKTLFAIAMLDIDYFKKINDTYGHDMGDQALRGIAKCLLGNCREADSVGRWGGEEFLIIFDNTHIPNIAKFAERIRSTVESYIITGNNGEELNFTATIGLTVASAKVNLTIEQLISKADHALYEGKRSGRNKVVFL
jgi:diguanylate cyclase (GGDEF)-like protein